MISCKLEDVIIRHKKPRQTGKPMTCFIVEIIAGKNYCSLKRRFFDPVQQSFDVSLIKCRVARRDLETDVGGHQIDERPLPPAQRYSATGA